MESLFRWSKTDVKGQDSFLEVSGKTLQPFET